MDLGEGRISIPKMPNIKAVISRRFEGTVKSVTISKTPSGKFFRFCSGRSCWRVADKATPSEATAVGIDLGIKDFWPRSRLVIKLPIEDGRIVDKLKTLQNASRKVKDVRGVTKLGVKVAHLRQEDLAGKRLDFLHKLATKIVSENQTVCIEDSCAE